MKDAQLNEFHWTVRYEGNAVQLRSGHKPRQIKGWSFTAHDGCERFAEGNWFDLVNKFNLAAGNYGFTHTLS